jgi:Metal-dependent hydrolase
MQLKLLSVVLSTLFFATSSFGQHLVVGSYNIRYDNRRDSGNLWEQRAPYVAGLIRFHDFDVLGTQEGMKHQLDQLSDSLPDYAWYGKGRDDGKEKGEFSAIFYKKHKFRVLKSGDFWLSPTPEKPGPGWDAHLNRICSWVQLEDKATKKKFFVFNVHYDHEGVKAREESSKLILEKIRSIAGNSPVVLTGDFNGDHKTSWYQALANSEVLKDSYTLVKDPYANNNSFNGWNPRPDMNKKQSFIDHVFISKSFEPVKWGLLTDTYYGRYPSDHFPVYVKLKWK